MRNISKNPVIGILLRIDETQQAVRARAELETYLGAIRKGAN